jgi:hypothetical protein
MDKEHKKFIDDLIRQRDELLKEHPELRKVQEEIDTLLAPLGDNHLLRAQLLCKIMVETLKNRLIPAMQDLRDTVAKATKAVKKCKEEESILCFYNKKIENF